MLRAILLGLCAFGLAQPVAAQEIAPHRAIYEVTLAEATASVDDVQGLLSVELSRSCDQWTYSQRFELRLMQDGEEPSGFSFQLAAWESLDGKTYGFRSTTTEGEGPGVAIVGRASVNADGKASAWYTEPAAFDRPLPNGTLFPVGWLKAGLKASAEGVGRFRGHVFMGAAPDEPLRVNSIIVAAKPIDPADASSPLLMGARWRHLSAFFTPKSLEAPEYEAEETVLENGVLAGAVMRYPGYSLAIRLKRIEALPGPGDC